ncbi:hypothetical protein CRE_08888 [Caenorhabditis remanei]|uniref:Uncharacterized protein n=1 Tax=Caenorhabditis remanei TaxID=31234 RepID=E3LI47_CAERE|nr:hypothetical protein CRE_08888 [Caenorhabditis remanei]
MKYLLLFVILCFITLQVSGECLDECECQLFTNLALGRLQTISNMSFTEGAGCVNKLFCKNNNILGLGSTFSRSELDKPVESDILPPDDVKREEVEAFSQFGIICENGTWYATKYPRVRYNHGGMVDFPPPFSQYDGKKSEIVFFVCAT